MEDANTYFVNRMLREQEQQEVALDKFEQYIDEKILEIDEIIIQLKKISEDYQGYDFTEELDDMLKDIL